MDSGAQGWLGGAIESAAQVSELQRLPACTSIVQNHSDSAG